MTSGGNSFSDFYENQLDNFRAYGNLLIVRCSIRVPSVINSIYWSAFLAQKYLPEQYSDVFRHGCL